MRKAASFQPHPHLGAFSTPIGAGGSVTAAAGIINPGVGRDHLCPRQEESLHHGVVRQRHPVYSLRENGGIGLRAPGKAGANKIKKVLSTVVDGIVANGQKRAGA